MFLFRLALTMGMTVRRLLDELSIEELVEWMAYERIEQFGHPMDNFRMGVLASTVANVAPRGRHARVMKPADFYPAKPSDNQLTARQQKELRERAARKRKS